MMFLNFCFSKRDERFHPIKRPINYPGRLRQEKHWFKVYLQSKFKATWRLNETLP